MRWVHAGPYGDEPQEQQDFEEHQQVRCRPCNLSMVMVHARMYYVMHMSWAQVALLLAAVAFEEG